MIELPLTVEGDAAEESYRMRNIESGGGAPDYQDNGDDTAAGNEEMAPESITV